MSECPHPIQFNEDWESNPLSDYKNIRREGGYSSSQGFVCWGCPVHGELPLWLQISPSFATAKWTMHSVTSCGDRRAENIKDNYYLLKLINFCWLHRGRGVYLTHVTTIFQNYFFALTLQSWHFINGSMMEPALFDTRNHQPPSTTEMRTMIQVQTMIRKRSCLG